MTIESKTDPKFAGSAAAVTRLLNEAGAGSEQGAAELMPLVYQRLRDLAAALSLLLCLATSAL